MLVWTPDIRPLGWYHRITEDGTRTECQQLAVGHGYKIPSGEAVSYGHRPCLVCFTAPRPAPPTFIGERSGAMPGAPHP